MPSFNGPLGYEFIRERRVGTQWRVHDKDDNAITSFPTEKEAEDYVDAVNNGKRGKPSWNFYNNDINV
jgi:hypothetical protein